MRVYQCDSCKKTITNPHDVKMKEFYVGIDYRKRKIKIHLCDDCYKGLHLIAENRRSENNG